MRKLLARAASRLGRSARAGLYGLGLEGVLYRRPQRDRAIVMYHGIDRHGRRDFNLRFCGVSDFERHLDYYRRRFEVVPLREIFERDAFTTRPGLALTFDDGYRNNLTHALPLLQKRRMPATLFVTSIVPSGHEMLWADAVDICTRLITASEVSIGGVRFSRAGNGRFFSSELSQGLNAYVSRLDLPSRERAVGELRALAPDFRADASLEDYWRLLSEQDLRRVAELDLLEIGSHGQLHSDLRALPKASAEAELRHSKAYLEAVSGRPVCSLAYPFGSYRRETLDLAGRLGFSFQLAAEDYLHPEDVTDPRIRNRVGIYSDRSWVEQLHQVRAACR